MGGEGARIGDGGGGGVGRVAPIKFLGGKLAVIISKSNLSPTKMHPGVAVSLGEFHCPFKEASSVGWGQYHIELPTWLGYAPSIYLRILLVENCTAALHTKETDKSGEGWNPE
jgi:hypothetical protein